MELQNSKTYLFKYNNQLYQGRFIYKQQKNDYDEYFFTEFTLKINGDESFFILKEWEHFNNEYCFSDSESESESESELENEYDIIEEDDHEYIFIS